ncbi:MAG TPA: hypothetical protein VHZ53_18715 [Steroidobacteraceae bacterium]|jgi:hypothetical protein|nr:hypothetical protein [Steroidobacteraceae bacterium]
MRLRTGYFILAAFSLMGGCQTQSSTKPVEVLDERTGMTFAALDEPLELLPDLANAVLIAGKRSTFAYLGPVEWDRMGTISYGLWLHVAPGNGRQPGNIKAPGAVVLGLDDGPLPLTLMSAPPTLGKQPYREAVSWGETAYFNLDVPTLRRIAASSKVSLSVPGADGAPMIFSASGDPHATLTRYLESRGLGTQ